MKRIISENKNKVIYAQDGTCYKVFNPGYSKSAILNEALNNARAEETGLSVPKILAVETIDGKWAILSEYIEGNTIEQLLNEHPEKQEEYLKIFVDAQMNIHNHTNLLLNLNTARLNRRVSESDLPATLRYDLRSRLDSMPVYHQICHGDYNPSSVIINNEGKAYVVDWSRCTIGNDTSDVANTYLKFILNGNEEIGRKYLKLFVEKSGRSLESVLAWLPILAASEPVKEDEKQQEILNEMIQATEKELVEKYGKI